MRCQVIMAGVGGQGVLFASRVLSEAARRRCLGVLGSQSFGMAQRGGSVAVHLKIGDHEGPLIRHGHADLLLGFNGVEASRNIAFLRRSGAGAATGIVNIPDADIFPDPTLAGLLDSKGVRIYRCDADGVAVAIDNPRAANLVLLGFAAGHEAFPFAIDELRSTVETISSDCTRAGNLAAVERGWALSPGRVRPVGSATDR